MFIRFVVSNFLSFQEECEFNMIASSYKTHKHHVSTNPKLNILKSAAIYGANGAGKSNLIKALEFLQKIVNKGELNKSINSKKFKLNSDYINKPVLFEIDFLKNNKIYNYGVRFNNISVSEEWLYESSINGEDKLIFERKEFDGSKAKISLAKKYSRTQKQKLLIELMQDSLLKPKELLLSKFEELKIDDINIVRNSIINEIVIIHPGSKFQNLIPAMVSEDFKTFTNNLLKTFDTGVNELGIEIIPIDKYLGEEHDKLKEELKEEVNDEEDVILNTDNDIVLVSKVDNKLIVKKAITHHITSLGEKIAFDLIEESDGTQRLLDIIPALDGILHHDVAFFIDEIDQSLHPSLLKALLQKILEDESSKGQLIFTTHESNLLSLDIFRQDEIWFVEKKSNIGSSELYSLSEFKPRYDLDIRKGYLKGRFGAIPFLAELDNLNWQLCNED